MADIGARRNHVDNSVAHVLGVRCGEAHHHSFGGIGYHPEECGKIHFIPLGVFVEIGIYILPKKCYLLEPFRAQIGEFVEDTLRLATAFPAAGVRHDAVAAKIVAAAHNADKSAYLVVPETRGYHIAIGLGG